MDPSGLTPIRVRGKRKSRNDDGNQQRPARQRPRFKRPSAGTPSQSTRQRQTGGARKPPAPPSKLSRLELLPTEIIERIFALSLEPNLAVASPWIGRRVSSRRIYRAFMLYSVFQDYIAEIFQDTGTSDLNDDSLLESIAQSAQIDRNIFQPIEYEPLGDEDRLKLQQAIMCRRWFNLERFFDMQSRLLDICWKEQVIVYQKLSEDPRPLLGEMTTLPDMALTMSHREGDGDDTDDLPPGSFRIPQLIATEVAENGQFYKFRWKSRVFCHMQHIPDKLLQPIHLKANPDALQLLCTIIELTFHPNEFSSILGPAYRGLNLNHAQLKRAVTDAVNTANAEALRVFAFLMSYCVTLGNEGSKKPNYPYPRKLSDVWMLLVDPEVYRIATSSSLPASPSVRRHILEILCTLPFSQYTIPRNNPHLSRWALKELELAQCSEDKAFPRDLLDFMETGDARRMQHPLFDHCGWTRRSSYPLLGDIEKQNSIRVIEACFAGWKHS